MTKPRDDRSRGFVMLAGRYPGAPRPPEGARRTLGSLEVVLQGVLTSQQVQATLARQAREAPGRVLNGEVRDRRLLRVLSRIGDVQGKAAAPRNPRLIKYGARI